MKVSGYVQNMVELGPGPCTHFQSREADYKINHNGTSKHNL